MSCDVLIVGAGPTGLVLAIWLARLGVSIRIVEKNDGPGQTSRAMAVQARTLEYYRQLGFADEVIDAGIVMSHIRMWEARHEIASFDIHDFGEGLSPFPFVLTLPQDDHEKLLGKKLSEAGVTVEWRTELTEFVDHGDGVTVNLTKDGTQETLEVKYLCGCDGAHSRVRQGLKLEFSGGTYKQSFFVADVEATGNAANQDLNMCLQAKTFGLSFPIRSSGHNRLIGVVPDSLDDHDTLTFEDVRASIEDVLGIQVTKVDWFSSYRVHHRVAEKFAAGRVFIAGDAGHIHSPAGGQGMNTGIGDAVNLGWKVAAVLQGRGNEALLSTYEPERIAFARALVATTDRAFRAIIDPGFGGEMMRTLLIPHLGPFALGFSGVRKAAFKLISQVRVNYHESALSRGELGDIQAGDRLPFIKEIDNFGGLSTLDWQVHVCGVASQPLMDLCRSRRLPRRDFANNDEARAAGFTDRAAYLVRPDGYAAFISATQSAPDLAQFLDEFGIVAK